jgi:hypothetical protein
MTDNAFHKIRASSVYHGPAQGYFSAAEGMTPVTGPNAAPVDKLCLGRDLLISGVTAGASLEASNAATVCYNWH